MNKGLFTLLLSCCVFYNATAQLLFDTASSYDYLVKQVLLEEKSDLIIKNVKYSGADFSIGAFRSSENTGLIDSGIVLSTGNIYHTRGPNSSIRTGVRSSGMSDAALQAIATGVVTDAAVLEFDLLALRDSISFEYVFASEEYPEYVDKGVNDIFGFFITEQNSRAIRPQNIARLPDNRTVVSIDNVNHRRNEAFFLRSDFLEAHDTDFWLKNKEMMLRAHTFELDGFTKILKATIILKEGKWYHLKIAIADVGDRYYDSAVFLKANSMRSNGKRIEQADSIVADVIQQDFKELSNLKIESKGRISFSLQINFNSNKYEILKESYRELSQLIALLRAHNDIKVSVVGHTDNIGDELANQVLSNNRAKAVRDYLVLNGIKTSRISFSGMGEIQPISSNETEQGRLLNRRVEFSLRY